MTSKKKVTASALDLDQRLVRLATLGEQIALLNTRHATIKLTNEYVVIDERPETAVSLLSYPQFINRYRAHVPTVPGRMTTLGRAWLDNLAHRHYDGQLVFMPYPPGAQNPASTNDYNLWTGFAVTPSPGRWNLLHDHIHDNICGGDERLAAYVLNWCALLAQQPGRLPEAALCLRGPMGTGKTVFVDHLARWFPPQAVATVTKPEQITGRFNSILSGRVLVFADEAFFAGNLTMRGALQSLITDRRLAIERKGLDIVMEQNCVHLLMASNENWVLSMSSQDRRFLVLDVSSQHRLDFDYFNRIARQQDEEGGTAAFLYDSLSRDLSLFNPKDIPWTAASQDQVNRSRKGPEAWLYDFLTHARAATWPTVQPKRAVWASYLRWVDQTRERYPSSEPLFWKYVIDVFGHGVVGQQRNHGQLVRVCRFPRLDEARRLFDPREAWPDDAGRPMPVASVAGQGPTMVVPRRRRRR
jgi:hypothetical protein